MTTQTDAQTFLASYVEDLNAAVESRQFPPFVMKWFDVQDCSLNFHHETAGLDKAKELWKHLLPTGPSDGMPREVNQFPYKVEDNVVWCWRQLVGGNAPKPLYGLQETGFDDRTLINSIFIHSVQDKPEVEEDPQAPRSRLGRIFLAFADVFNEYFLTGNTDLLDEWCSDDIEMKLDSTFWNMGVIGPHNRIAQAARFSLRDFQETGESELTADVGFTNWGGLDGASPWHMQLTPERKIRALNITLEL